jgi:hypothetical protein
MAKHGPVNSFLLVGGLNVSGQTFGLEENIEESFSDGRGLGVAWGTQLPNGVATITLETQPGLYDDDAAAAIGALTAYQEKGATTQLSCWGVEGSALGAEVTMLNGDYASKWIRIASKDNLHLAHAEHTLSGAALIGEVIHGLTAESADGDTEAASLDNSASSASGATCDLHVPALTLAGYTDVVIKVRDSSDDIAFGDLVTFTAVTAVGAERKTVSGTIERYVAMSWAWTGAGSTQSVIPFVVVNRG